MTTEQGPILQGSHNGGETEDTETSWFHGIVRLVVIALVLGGAYYAYTSYQASRVVHVGDCIEEQAESSSADRAGRRGRGAGGSDEPKKVDCTDAKAAKVVLAEQPSGGESECIDIDGVDAETTTSEPEFRTLCLGRVGVDPATAVNSITQGECMIIGADDTARRAECSEPEALEVLAILRDISSVPNPLKGEMAPCDDAGADSAEALYTWSMQGEYTSALAQDRGACLAEAGRA